MRKNLPKHEYKLFLWTIGKARRRETMKQEIRSVGRP